MKNKFFTLTNVIENLNKLGEQRIPFLFILDFDLEIPIILPLNEINPNRILYSINGVTNAINTHYSNLSNPTIIKHPVSKKRYRRAFNYVQKHLNYGNSFLINLTMPSRIEINMELEEIFHRSNARYKLWIKNKFVVFSPEIFIQTKGQKISSFPMKGTIDAHLPNAKQKLLNDEKELAEHYTIVDLIRNDLSIIAKNVTVKRFRFIDKLITNNGELLQMSSEISGELPKDYQDNIGSILLSMLPAGSISGAPKPKTLKIIKEAEKYKRGYYTGVCGIFDGENIDSGVMIRYIEQTSDGMYYKSGGGITAKSNVDNEYQELIDKIYVPAL